MENVEKNIHGGGRDAARIDILPISELRFYEKNPRKNSGAVDYVKASIEKFGFKVPVIVDCSRNVICGHTRILAAKSLGLSEVPCIIASDLTDAQVKAFRLADNRVAEFSKWDKKLLNDEIEDLKIDCDFDMGDFGFDDKFMSDLDFAVDCSEDDEHENPNETGVNAKCAKKIIVECSSESERQMILETLSSLGVVCKLVG